VHKTRVAHSSHGTKPASGSGGRANGAAARVKVAKH
jgi:hypothetical protein